MNEFTLPAEGDERKETKIGGGMYHKDRKTMFILQNWRLILFMKSLDSERKYR